MASPAFKAGEAGDPCLAGSIPVHLRYMAAGRERGQQGGANLPPMKKLLLLVILVALAAAAAKKVRTA